jgi:hypothetical protein
VIVHSGFFIATINTNVQAMLTATGLKAVLTQPDYTSHPATMTDWFNTTQTL